MCGVSMLRYAARKDYSIVQVLASVSHNDSYSHIWLHRTVLPLNMVPIDGSCRVCPFDMLKGGNPVLQGAGTGHLFMANISASTKRVALSGWSVGAASSKGFQKMCTLLSRRWD